jgi:hypothetical protein
MAIPIKTLVLKALVTALETATDLVTVMRFPPTGINLDTINAPAAFIHEGVPEQRETNNRFYRGILELDIVVFIQLQSIDADRGNLEFLDKADEIQGQIHNILHSTGHPELTGLAIKILERQVEKVIPNDSWGVLVYTVDVTYQHLTGNAFSRS